MGKYYNYKRLTLADRNSIESALNKNTSGREIAGRLGRSNSTISEEIRRNRTISIGKYKGQRVTDTPSSVCARLTKWPYVCNGCKQWHYHCYKPFKCEYNSVYAHRLAQELNKSSRQGVDMSQSEFEYIVHIIKTDLKKGLSPYQISVSHPELKLSESSIYRWTKKGYGSLSVMYLQKQVKYKPRSHKENTEVICRSSARTYDAFLKLHSDLQESACEMDTVIGRRQDKKCILTLYLRPSKLQLYILLNSKTCDEVKKALDALEKLFKKELFKEIFYPMLTDNGPEFYYFKLLEKSVFPGYTSRTIVYYCNPYASGQKGGCEKNHVELRKLLPKDMHIPFDKLDIYDMAECMSQVNSQPRKSLGGLSPIAMFRAMYGSSAMDVLESLGVKELKPSELLLKPQAIFRERDKRGVEKLL